MLLSISIVTLLVCQLNAYDFKCPSASQWDFRGNSKCPNTELLLYTCLLSVTISSYLEFCGPEEIYRYGTKYVLRPNPTPTNCSVEFYQPFFFTSIGNSQCVYSKSTCSGEGQIIASNRTSREDRSCRCDYTRGYMYVIPPKNGCTCVPSEEDCSCVYRPCTKREQTLHKDYKCYDEVYILPEKIACEAIERNIITSPSSVNQTQPFQLGKLSQGFVIQPRKSALIPAFVILLLIILVVLIISLQYVFPVVIDTTISSKVNLVGKKSDEYAIVYGDTIYIQTEIQSFFKVKSVVWQKIIEGKIVNTSEAISKNNMNTEYELCIPNVSSDNAGIYCCIVTNVLGISNNFLPSYFGSFKIFKKEFPALQSCLYHLSIKVLLSDLKEERKTVIVENDAILKASSTTLDKKILWIYFKDGIPTRIDPSKNPDKYDGCTTADPYLTIKRCSETDAGTYVCVQVDENKRFLEDVCKKWKLQITKQREYYEKIIEHRKLVINGLYVKTKTVNEVKEGLEKTGIALVTGREGTGKTELCLEIASLYDDLGTLPVIITSFNKVYIESHSFDVLYMIDHASFEEDSLVTLINEIRSKSNTQHVSIISTCRKQDLHFFTKALRISKSQVFDLDQSLAEKEKQNIFQNYRERCMDVKSGEGKSLDQYLDKEAVETIIKSESWRGFPLTVKQFCGNSQLWKEREKYFVNPTSSIVSDLKNLFDKAKRKENEEEPNDTDSVVQCCVLAYILKHPQHQLVVSEFEGQLFIDARTSLFKIAPSPKNDSNILKSVMEAAHNITNIYLNFADNVYTFINPCLPQALLLGAPKVLFLDFFQNGSLQDIMKHLTYGILEMIQRDIPTIELASWYEILFRRLTESCLKDSSLIRDIGNFIYRNWIKHDDHVFKEEIVKHLNFKITEFVKSSRSVDSSNERQESISSINELEFRSWVIILLMEEISKHGKDPWIYQNDPSDFIIIFGLIISSKGHYMVKCKETFNILSEKLEKKLTSHKQPTILEFMNSSLDRKGNTFFHYLCLFNTEDCIKILDPNGLFDSKEKGEKNEKQLLSKKKVDLDKKNEKGENQLLSKKNRQKFGKQNELNISPLELAAYLGKFPVFMTFLLATEQSVISKQRQTLLQITEFGKQIYYGQDRTKSSKHSEKNIKFTGKIEDIFNQEIAICITIGNEEEYKKMLQKLADNVRKDNFRKSLKSE